MLHAQESCEQDAAWQQTCRLTCQNDGQDEETVHEAIVLEVYVIDDQ